MNYKKEIKSKGLILSFIMLLISVSLYSQSLIRINGTVDTKDYPKIVLINIQANKQVAASDIDETGKFSMSFPSIKTDFYRLSLNDNDKKYVFLVLEPNENVQINLKVNDLNSSKVSGSKQSEFIFQTFQTMKDYDKKAEEYTRQMQKEKIEYLRNNIIENKSSLATLIFMENFKIENDPNLFQEVSSSLNKNYVDNAFVVDLNRRVQSALKMGIGAEAPEITLYSPDSVLISLSSLRGKVVLIDFWASWCGPCRRESPHMVQLYNMYKDKGFEIFSVSLDNDRNKWIQAIKADNLTWTHVSDLKHWKSSVVPLYGFKGIPYTVLIDKNGKIVAKGLRGEQLKTKVGELLN